MSDAWLARYRLVRKIGSGGMADVFLAEFTGAEGFARELVVKRMHPALAMEPASVALFINEARIAARLRHPNVVQVYDFGHVSNDYYLAMELVDGRDLAAIERYAAPQGGVPLGVGAYIIGEVLEALAYVHTLADAHGGPAGLVHRDVSPHNVLIGTAGEVKLTDFGIARANLPKASTAPEEIRGKIGYMAPEQARGEALDARADLFAVGAVLYELWTGKRPHKTRDDGDTLDAVRAGTTVPPMEVSPGLHPALARVLTRALAPDPKDRYADAPEFSRALHVAMAEAGVTDDRLGTRKLVRETLGADVVSTGESRDPTLTAPDAAPARVEAPPSVGSRWLLDAAAVGVGVAAMALALGTGLGVLPHARTTTRTAAASRVVRIAVSADGPPGDWPAGAERQRLGVACGCQVLTVRAGSGAALGAMLRDGDADLAMVSTVVLPALLHEDLVRRLDTLLPAVDPGAWVSVRAATRGDILSVGVGHGDEGEGDYFAPVGVDAVALLVRGTDVRSAVDGFAGVRAGLDARLRGITGHGLPTGFALRSEPDAWTTWDFLAVGYTWSQQHGYGCVWLPEGPTRTAWLVHAARAAATGEEAPGALTETLSWDVVGSALGVLADSVGLRADPVAALRDSRVSAVIAPVSALGASGTDGWLAGPVPRGDTLGLDPAGDPVHQGMRGTMGEAWGWVIARGSGHPAVAARVLLTALHTGVEAPGGFHFGAMDVELRTPGELRGSWGRAREVMETTLAGGTYALARVPGALQSYDATVARPWELWRRAVFSGMGTGNTRLDPTVLAGWVSSPTE